METTCHSNKTDNPDSRVLRTAVIHTAPACHSVVDLEKEAQAAEATSRSLGLEELWTPVNSSLWKNAQLNLSLSSGDSEFSVNFFFFFFILLFFFKKFDNFKLSSFFF